MNYTTKDGKLYADGAEIQLRGISHYGFNADILQPQFLWAMGWKAQLAQIKSLGFNAIRVPFVPDTLYVATSGYEDQGMNPELVGKTPLQILDLWMTEADRLGLYLLLDFHSVTVKGLHSTWYTTNFSLIYNQQQYTKEHWIRDLVIVAKRYAHLPHFLGLDLYNEPNGVVRWDVGDRNMTNTANYWKPAAELAAKAVLAANANLLVFVQGIGANWDGHEDSSVPTNFGENLRPQSYQPLAIPADKLVLSPHTYGPDVWPKKSFTAPNYPANLAADWEALFGQFHGRHAVVIGEWGGRYGQGVSASTGKPSGPADVAWQNALVDWLISKGMRSSFYWCYTPNSGDTGGILADDLTVRQDKMTLLRRLWGAAPVIVPPPPPTPPADKLDQVIGLLTEIRDELRGG